MMINMLRPDFTEHFTPEKCNNARYCWSFDASGQRIKPCIFGPYSNCSQCGAYGTTLAESLVSLKGIISNLQNGIGKRGWSEIKRFSTQELEPS